MNLANPSAAAGVDPPERTDHELAQAAFHAAMMAEKRWVRAWEALQQLQRQRARYAQAMVNLDQQIQGLIETLEENKPA